MALQVDYKHCYGSFTETQRHGDEEQTFKVEIFKANCICAAVYRRWNEDDTFNANLLWFFVDTQHMRSCIKNNVLKDSDNFVFYADRLDTETWSMIQTLAKNGKHITIN